MDNKTNVYTLDVSEKHLMMYKLINSILLIQRI